ncbi:TM10B methyltransferase, partial [Polypterus senegalus]
MDEADEDGQVIKLGKLSVTCIQEEFDLTEALELLQIEVEPVAFKESCTENEGLYFSMERTEENCLKIFPPECVIYLTPDSENALEYVDPEKVYILGGLVDESVQKSLTYQKAQEYQLCTARLPVEEYMVKKENAKNFHSQILAINQVFDILVAFCESHSWIEAFKVGFPAGKGYNVRTELVQCKE